MNSSEPPAPEAAAPKPERFSRLVFWLLALNVILLLAAACVAPLSLTDFQRKLVVVGLLGEVILVPAFCCWHRRWGWAAAFVIVGLLNAIAIPNFTKPRVYRSRTSCIANLKQIDGAVQQWALENNKKATDSYSFGDKSLLAYMKGSVLPDCPQGGRYSPGENVGGLPKCSLAAKGHTL